MSMFRPPSASWICCAALLLMPGLSKAAEVIPPVPPRHFNDYANVVPAGRAAAMDEQLRDFEKATSNQLVVAVYPKMQSDSSIEDYTVRVAQAWGVGQKQRKNGVVLFVFVRDRQMFIQVGYGLEGALPDATAKQIIDTEITPRFKSGDYAGGLQAGITAIMAATRGEYKGTGGGRGPEEMFGLCPMAGFFFLLILLGIFSRMFGPRGRLYGRSPWWIGGMIGGYGGGGWSRGGGGGGWSSGGGGGGFSSGGGSFGGGGAGGRW